MSLFAGSTFDELHSYFFRFEQENHHAGEYQNYIEHFAVALKNGEIPKPDLKEGIHTLAVMEAMDTSIRTGERVFVDDILKKRGITLS